MRRLEISWKLQNTQILQIFRFSSAGQNLKFFVNLGKNQNQKFKGMYFMFIWWVCVCVCVGKDLLKRGLYRSPLA